MPNWLIDASVALKWFLPEADEPDGTQARALVGRLTMRTTTLAEFEIANRLVRSGDLPLAEVVDSLSVLRTICGEPLALEVADHALAAELARRHGLTFYDASYAAVAVRTDRKLISADSDLLDPGLAVAVTDVSLP